MNINPKYKLLATGYNYMDVVVDLYGDFCGDADVQDVTLAGDKRSIGALIPGKAYDAMNEFADRAIATARRESQINYQIARFECDRLAA
jgi:hypothetical protein